MEGDGGGKGGQRGESRREGRGKREPRCSTATYSFVLSSLDNLDYLKSLSDHGCKFTAKIWCLMYVLLLILYLSLLFLI